MEKHLTVNQIMLLLAIYRGTLMYEKQIGTYSDDMALLSTKKLIKYTTKEDAQTTSLGDALVIMLKGVTTTFM